MRSAFFGIKIFPNIQIKMFYGTKTITDLLTITVQNLYKPCNLSTIVEWNFYSLLLYTPILFVYLAGII